MTHRIVIVGGGAGGLELATRLGKTLGKKGTASVTLVDANLTHIWKPLLHEVAAGSLNSYEDELNYVAQAKWNNFQFQLGRMTGLDRENRQIHLAATQDENGAELVPARSLGYDSLVLAVGSTTNDFGTQGAAEHCLFLDSRKQAERFHQQLLNHYLRAHAGQADSTQEITVAIVGAGATGVELAAELHNAAHELASYGLGQIKPENLRITVIEAGPRVLPALPERIGAPVHKTLEKLGVTVLTNSAVSEVTAEGLVTASGQVIPAVLKVWAAGIRAPAFLHELDGLESNRINQLQVLPTLQTTRDENIFAFGDCAACPQKGTDRNVPPRAQAAHQQASLLVKSLRLRIEGKALPEYTYKDYGSLISLSSFSAVGNLMGNLMGSVMLEGWLARMFYISLYRMHQMALYGAFRTLMLMLGSKIGKGTEPRMKLH
ncbi:NAD(P)/FAD-dependent oxidoreductase [Pseudomonas lijiangensis]|uniref:NAD(P)/FAD-dependent oxidoreductase n=1 Tax=Pseudomonas lijiangensis TaxID=2995658 RepID=A0ABX8HPR3_9PSED|nr:MULTISPECIES: NAD(P)/FAD-dependent oxidoreductase [Pseudomonas syringae group]MBX8500263.1 NAD(P)/FAD-dependent oxidoreductase [Pseudomonas lijiangensis]MBX8505514.1 NAD(P)/FAD-dependent oxidoreductase [Pseudomonas lijiangensis]MBX8521658.1 NAD(P)/FAD-dependent oxidoreductase [Pseudomonas cichorii]MBX8535591.1 NAD(P)/FAD-dependent oxidoreductase [Pseudomonas cichorii]MBX8549033.1 NAD(P)/FAD-dependent oxidoreductase [Pseudomonas cichorii]